MRAGIRRLKFLIAAPDFQPWDLGHYLHRLFKAEGMSCETFGYGRLPDRPAAGRELLRRIGERRPDVSIGLKLDGVPVGTLRELGDAGVFRVLWYVDCFTDEVPGWMAPRLRESDLFLTTAKGMVPRYRSLARHEVDWLYEGAYLPAFPRRSVTRSTRGCTVRTWRSSAAFFNRRLRTSALPDIAAACWRNSDVGTP